jgi:hypothetical protein
MNGRRLDRYSKWYLASPIGARYLRYELANLSFPRQNIVVAVTL